MLTWCAILFVLGVAAFLDTIFNYGDIFRQINAVMFMLLSLGLLVRTTTKMKNRRIENYLARIDELEKELYATKKKPKVGA